MATTERDLLDRLVNPQGFSGTAALLGASFTPGVSTAVDAASALDAVRKRDPLNFGLSTLGLLPFISGTTVRVGGEAAGRGIKSLVENLYHGSPSLFRKFRKARTSGLYGVGNYLTNLRKTAETYARKDTPSHFLTTTSDELGDPLGYVYNVNVRAPESEFIDYYSKDLGSQPTAWQQIYQDLNIPENINFDNLRAVSSDNREIRKAARRLNNAVIDDGFYNAATEKMLTGGLEGFLRKRGIPGLKLDPDLDDPIKQNIRRNLGSGPEVHFVVFDENLIDIIGKPTPIFPYRVGGSSTRTTSGPVSFSSFGINQLNRYLRNR